MNGSTENTANEASENPGRPDKYVDLPTAQRMLPLVRRIIADLVEQRQRLAELKPEAARLETHRRQLAWPERQRRYRLMEEIRKLESVNQQTTLELENLGVALLEPILGRVGFPTVVNDHRAFFSWRPGEEGLTYWHFAGETVRRVIPPTWLRAADTSASVKK